MGAMSGPPQTTPELPPPIDARPSRRSGCLLALYALFGLGALVIVGLVVAGYFFYRSPEGQRLVSAVRESAEWAAEASKAPGTDALRAAGCSEAMVSTRERLVEMLSSLMPDGGAEEFAQAPGLAGDELVVACQLGFFARDAPACDVIARAYGEGVEAPPARYFVVVVQGSTEHCSGTYSPGGELLDPLRPQEQKPEHE